MQLAQAIHAAGESSPGDLKPGTHAIALAARDSAHLAEITKRLSEAGLPFVRIVEDSRPYAGDLLSVGVRPGLKSVVGRPLSDLPLVRDPRPPMPPPAPQPAPEAVEAPSFFDRVFGGLFGRKLP